MLKNKYNIKFSPHYWARPSSEGFTLIEVLISIAVFTIGIFAALGLSVSNYNDSRNNLDRIIATNLAREGIELIKNVRDSNWLKIDSNDNCGGSPCAWNYGLNGTTDYVVISYASTTPNFLPACGMGMVSCIKDNASINASTRLSINATNYYLHSPDSPTKYHRAIKLEKICLKSDGVVEGSLANPQNFEYLVSMSGDCNPGETQIGLKLTSHVQWEDGDTKYIDIVDLIYNWRR